MVTKTKKNQQRLPRDVQDELHCVVAVRCFDMVCKKASNFDKFHRIYRMRQAQKASFVVRGLLPRDEHLNNCSGANRVFDQSLK